MKRIIARISLVFLIAVLLPAQALGGCAASARSISASNFFFDTIITITLYGTEDETPINECFALAEKYEKLFSNTVEGSDVWEINAHPGERVCVSPETIELIETGIRYGEISDGAFDITVGKLSDLWNFSEIAESLESEDNEADASVLPDQTAIEKLLPHINYKNLIIENHTVCLNDADAKLDLGGIAKGYIADRMKESLAKAGVSSGIINLGGNVLTIGEKKDGSNYTIGIQKPFSATGEPMGSVSVNDRSVVTSGVYERYYRVNGRLYHHILDLTTGYPFDNGLYSVTIISESSVDGDALSTTCFALGLDAGLQLVESLPDTEAVFVDSSQNVHCSSGITFTAM